MATLFQPFKNLNDAGRSLEIMATLFQPFKNLNDANRSLEIMATLFQPFKNLSNTREQARECQPVFRNNSHALSNFQKNTKPFTFSCFAEEYFCYVHFFFALLNHVISTIAVYIL